jgi:phage/plasmid-like protein (TIGR03299 family)
MNKKKNERRVTVSKETYEWLAHNVLAGFQGEEYHRPVWWHDLARKQGHAPRTWAGAVPFDDVHELLAGWEPVVADILDNDTVEALIREGHAGADLLRMIKESAVLPKHKEVKTPDGYAVIGRDHALHHFGRWLTGSVAECVGDDAQISSACLLSGRMQASVTIEAPESVQGPGGIVFAPFITLSTSLDGSLQSQANRNTQLPICDNTLAVAREQGISIRHSKNSEVKLGTYRGVVSALARGETDIKVILDDLLSIPVSEGQFGKILDQLVPLNEDDTPAKKARSSRKRQEITTLYNDDPRVAGWKGTGFGALQAINTWDTHMSQLRNSTGYEMSDTDLRAMRQYAERMHVSRGQSADEKTIDLIKAVAA